MSKPASKAVKLTAAKPAKANGNGRRTAVQATAAKSTARKVSATKAATVKAATAKAATGKAATGKTSRPAKKNPPASNGNAHAERLAAGELRGMVKDYLARHPKQDFTPVELKKALNARSAGGVYVAVRTLVRHGEATLTSERPQRYRIGSKKGKPRAKR